VPLIMRSVLGDGEWSSQGGGEPVFRGRSIEHHSDLALLAPDDTALELLTIGWHQQSELLRYAYWTCYFEGRSSFREVSDSAVDGPTAEYDVSGVQDAMTRRSPVFAHNPWMAYPSEP
jgi:hypothetical protein